MNKKLVDRLIPIAYMELATVKIAKDNTIPKTFRGQIASFGAAVSSGSLLAATAFFNDQGGAKSERQKLMEAINNMMAQSPLSVSTGDTLFDTVRLWIQQHNGSDREIKEKVLCCAVALKLAMNLYHLEKDHKPKQEKSGEEGVS